MQQERGRINMRDVLKRVSHPSDETYGEPRDPVELFVFSSPNEPTYKILLRPFYKQLVVLTDRNSDSQYTMVCVTWRTDSEGNIVGFEDDRYNPIQYVRGNPDGSRDQCIYHVDPEQPLHARLTYGISSRPGDKYNKWNFFSVFHEDDERKQKWINFISGPDVITDIDLMETARMYLECSYTDESGQQQDLTAEWIAAHPLVPATGNP